MSRSVRPVSFALVSLLVLLSSSGCSHKKKGSLIGSLHPLYTITDLGIGEPIHINVMGEVIGTYPVTTDKSATPHYHAFLYLNGQRIDPGTFGGNNARPDQMNDNGDVVGSADTKNGTSHTFFYHDGKMQDLSRHGFTGAAIALNNDGSIIGAHAVPGTLNTKVIFRYEHDTPTIINVLKGNKIHVNATNSTGQIIGSLETTMLNSKDESQTARRAVSFQNGDIKDLGTLGGFLSEPTAITNAGDIIGHSSTKAPSWNGVTIHPFIVNSGKMKDLGTIKNNSPSFAFDVNNHSQIVGVSNVHRYSVEAHAVIWNHGQLSDLNDLIPQDTNWMMLVSARAINDSGQIAGTGLVKGDKTPHVFLLTPLPQ